MKHIWSVLCSKCIIDKNTNNLSLIEIIEEMKFATVIEKSGKGSVDVKLVSQMPIDWVTLWVRTNIEEPEKTKMKDIVISPSGKTILEKEYEIDLQSYKRMRATRKVLLPPTNENGIFLFLTQVNDEKNKVWSTVGDIPIFITIETDNTKILK